MYSNMKYYENICNCLRVIQQYINRKLKSANCWQRTSLNALMCNKRFTHQSRTSLKMDRRPDTTYVYDIRSYYRNVGVNFTTLPEYFKLNGYISAGTGKTIHPGPASAYDDPISWSHPYFKPKTSGWETHEHSWLAVPDDETINKPLVDAQFADHAIETLKVLAPDAKSGVKPLYLAMGFHKPHLPFVFIDLESII